MLGLHANVLSTLNTVSARDTFFLRRTKQKHIKEKCVAFPLPLLCVRQLFGKVMLIFVFAKQGHMLVSVHRHVPLRSSFCGLQTDSRAGLANVESKFPYRIVFPPPLIGKY